MPQDFSDVVIYADESGDHNPQRINPDFPLFVLTLCVFRKARYVDTVVPSVQRFKFRWFGHDMVVLHEREIRQHLGPFGILENSARRAAFMAELTALLVEAPFTLIAAVIGKRRLTARYGDPDNPYDIALTMGMERLYEFLVEQGQADALTHCVFERRGRKEDEDLGRVFRRVVGGDNFRRQRMPNLDIVFADKKTNSTGMQVADLTARPIGLKHLRPDQANRAFDVIEGKFRRNGQGMYRGYGLKVFP